MAVLRWRVPLGALSVRRPLTARVRLSVRPSGTVMVRWVSKHCDPVMATGWHMVLGGAPLLALAVAQEGDSLTDNLSQLTGAPVSVCPPAG
jgi:hypothetical protein